MALEGGEAHRPPYPWRLRMFVYGCADFATEYDAKLAGAKQARRGVGRGGRRGRGGR